MNKTDLDSIFKKLCDAKKSNLSSEDISKLSQTAGEICGYTSAYEEAIKDIADINAFNNAFRTAFNKSQQLIQNPNEATNQTTKKQKALVENLRTSIKHASQKSQYNQQKS